MHERHRIVGRALGVDLDANPAGAGPFLLEEHSPERRVVFRKNPTSWAADEVRLAGIEMVHVPNGACQYDDPTPNAELARIAEQALSVWAASSRSSTAGTTTASVVWTSSRTAGA